MKIDVHKIPPEGLTLAEDIAVSALDLETDIVKFRGPVRIKADIYKITNTVTVDAALKALIYTYCSRCLNEFEIDLQKKLRLSYPVNKLDPIIDLDQDIREEIILDYPLKPLCKANCKGLCPKCGKNLNDGGCSCAPT